MERDVEIGWAAGIFEGEGSISTINQRQRFTGWQCEVGMSDEDTVRKFATIIGVGRLYGPYERPLTAKGTKRKPIFLWKVTDQEGVLAFLSIMLPHLSVRRLARALECLADMIVQKPYIQ